MDGLALRCPARAALKPGEDEAAEAEDEGQQAMLGVMVAGAAAFFAITGLLVG